MMSGGFSAIGDMIELASPPKNGITSLVFGNDANISNTQCRLMASSWDKHVYLYDVALNKLLSRVDLEAPVFDCCFSASDNVIYAGGLNCRVIKVDWNTLQPFILGTHDRAVRALTRCKNTGILFSGSWDGKITAWDVKGECRIQNIFCGESVYGMDVGGNMLVVALANRMINIYDTRNFRQPLQTRESSLKFQTRCVRVAAPNPYGFICTSIEGRVAVEYFDPSPAAQAAKYAFKCHREPAPRNPGCEIVFPVNTAAFHPVYGTFCTGGSDGVVSLWDAKCKKRIRNYPRLHSGISSMAFAPDGSRLAMAASYTFDEGEKE